LCQHHHPIPTVCPTRLGCSGVGLTMHHNRSFEPPLMAQMGHPHPRRGIRLLRRRSRLRTGADLHIDSGLVPR
jgi:hypothetical protein